MTRGGGSGSRRGRGRRDPGAAHRGWAPLAPPREAPARPGTHPPRGRRAGPRRVAAAAAMSPGKPGAGGAGTRRTGWRRRRRRRRLEAVSWAPGIGRTAGPDSRGPGTFQGARGMKPAAREARPPRRLPRLRWALPPLLLLCRLGQVSSRGPSRAEGGWGGTGIPGTCPRCPPAGFGGWRGPDSSEPPPGGLAGTRPASRPSPLLGCPAPLGGRRATWCPSFPVEAPAGSRPSVARPSRSWSRLAGPALPPEAAGGGVCAEGARHGAGPTRPAGPEGPGRRAAAAAGERAGPPGGGRGAGPPGRGHRFWGKYPTGERGPLARVLPADRLLPGEVARFPGGLFRAWWAPALPPPPCVLASLFQIMLRLAFW